MTHFTLQIQGLGPLVKASIGVSAGREAALKAAGQPVPSFVHVTALIDTGASCTCVDPTMLAPLGLSSTGPARVTTPSTGTTAVHYQQFDVCLLIAGFSLAQPIFRRDTIAVVELDLKGLGVDVLIGRDILSECVLHYNGVTGAYTLAF